VTKTGKTCMKWTVQTPHKHNRTPQKFPNGGLGDHNYCRDPDGKSKMIWCYTTDSKSRWEYCDLGKKEDTKKIEFVQKSVQEINVLNTEESKTRLQVVELAKDGTLNLLKSMDTLPRNIHRVDLMTITAETLQ